MKKQRRVSHKSAEAPAEHTEGKEMPEHNEISEGTRVRFTQTHDKSHSFTGTVLRVHDDANLVDISVEPDGKAIEVETVMTANKADVVPVDEAA
jgi:hypothetical protein